MDGRAETHVFLSTLPATPRDHVAAFLAVAAAITIFAVAAPFASTPLAREPAFVGCYQSALAISDVITAVLLFSQFATTRSRPLILLASGYLFTAGAAIVHALTFPGLFSPTGLLAAGPQTTVWMFVIWHAGFPLLVLGYALDKKGEGDVAVAGPTSGAILFAGAAVALALTASAVLVTTGHDHLPVLLRDGRYTPAMYVTVSAVCCLCAAALAVLWFRRPRYVLDVWLMAVLCAWLCDIALSALVNVARYDLGFYAGRLYGLLAATFLLTVLLTDNVSLQAQTMRLLGILRRQQTEREWLFSAVVESSNDAIITQQLDGTVTSWNRAAERLFGYSAAEAIGQHIHLIVPEDRRGEIYDILERTAYGETIEGHATRRVRRDGREIDVILTFAPLRDASGRIVGASKIAHDVTEQRAAEAQLRQAQKMDAVGQLTGGVAHDFNNILTVITGTIGIVQDAVEDRPEIASICRMIDEAAERGAQLTRQLLAFARKQPLRPVEVDVNALTVETAKLLRPTIGERIVISSNLSAEAWPAMADPNQLATALVNLALNARDAMPDGGKLTLETRNVHLDESYVALNGEVAVGHHVMIAVSDTGAGIPPEDLERVFEPFFTTKEVGKGTGLGLSMVFGFVKQSGGHVKIYSEVGHGTSVKIYLPRSSGSTETAAEAAAAAEIRGGDETILIVEDDPLVRQYVVTQIGSLGYATLAAANAPEALALLGANPGIDLLFTDVIMPGPMNGRQLADEAVRRRPDLKVLYTSGYTENAILHHGRLDEGVLLLAKPYRKAELAAMLRTALA